MSEDEKEEVTETYASDPPIVAYLIASASLKNLAPAVLAAQQDLENPEKNAKNPHFGNRYADLGACMESARKCLNKHGIALVQTYAPAPVGTVAVITSLLHKSGEYITGTCTIPLDRDNAQGYGSAATYARRYGVQAIIGMVAEDDDDGNAASGGEGEDDDKPRRTTAKKGLFGNR